MCAYKTTSPIPVAEGGTGSITLTDHGVLVGGGTTKIDALAVGATGTILAGSTGADPIFTATPSVTSITFGAGSALSTFTDWNTWTPTVVGASTAGTTSYTVQDGWYTRMGNFVIAQFRVTYTAATGTGGIVIGGLPVTIAAIGSYVPHGTLSLSSAGTAWGAGITQLNMVGLPNTITALVQGVGSSTAAANVSIANTAAIIQGTIIYRV